MTFMAAGKPLNVIRHQCDGECTHVPAESIPYLGSRGYVRAITDTGAMRNYSSHQRSIACSHSTVSAQEHASLTDGLGSNRELKGSSSPSWSCSQKRSALLCEHRVGADDVPHVSVSVDTGTLELAQSPATALACASTSRVFHFPEFATYWQLLKTLNQHPNETHRDNAQAR